MLTSDVILLHNNTSPHRALRTRDLLEHSNWEFFGHSPYNLDLAPSNYHLFTYVKNWLGSHRLNSNEELVEGVKQG
jgi:hypothetical protein